METTNITTLNNKIKNTLVTIILIIIIPLITILLCYAAGLLGDKLLETNNCHNITLCTIWGIAYILAIVIIVAAIVVLLLTYYYCHLSIYRKIVVELPNCCQMILYHTLSFVLIVTIIFVITLIYYGAGKLSDKILNKMNCEILIQCLTINFLLSICIVAIIMLIIIFSSVVFKICLAVYNCVRPTHDTILVY